MPELSEQMIGNLLMASGVGAAGLYLLRDKVGALIGPFFSNQKNTPPTKDIFEDYSVHDIVAILIEDRQVANDEEGVMLIGTFGKHIYDYEIKEGKDENV